MPHSQHSLPCFFILTAVISQSAFTDRKRLVSSSAELQAKRHHVWEKRGVMWAAVVLKRSGVHQTVTSRTNPTAAWQMAEDTVPFHHHQTCRGGPQLTCFPDPLPKEKAVQEMTEVTDLALACLEYVPAQSLIFHTGTFLVPEFSLQTHENLRVFWRRGPVALRNAQQPSEKHEDACCF